MIYNRSSHIELDRDALANNLKFIYNFLDDGTKLSCVIKGNAYGHGIAQMVPALEALGVDHFSVFSSFEAGQAHKAVENSDSRIMIMGDVSEEHETWVIQHDIECFIYNMTSTKRLLKEAKKQQKTLKAHIELETGMHRHGFERDDWEDLVDLIKSAEDHIELKGICTHFAGAESSSNAKRIEMQQQEFDKGVKVFNNAGLEPERLHTSCSAAIIAYPEWNLDMVRIGILQYGLWPSKESQLTYEMKYDYDLGLKSVLSWHSSILEIKHVSPGEFIGYGNSFLAERPITIASVPVGYGYGYSRNLSNTGRVLVKGKRVQVIGIVNMNMFLIDVTKVDVSIGDRVTLIGKDDDQEIHVSYFGSLSSQLNYELLTRLDKTIPRSFKEA